MAATPRIAFNLALAAMSLCMSDLAVAQIAAATAPPSTPIIAPSNASVSVGQTLAVPTPIPAPAAAPALDSARAEILDKDRLDLFSMLEGRWDNEVQTFFEPEIGVPIPQRHDRLHTIIRSLGDSSFGASALFVEYRKDGENGAIVRQRVWTINVDPSLAALRLAAFAPKDGTLLEGIWRDPVRLSTLKPADFVAVSGCDIIWRRRADGFSGETRPSACKVVTNATPPRVLTVNERHDLSATTWDVRDIGVDERGTRVFGSADALPSRLRRANSFVCWAGSAKGNETIVVNDLVLHDQGGTATAQLAGATPSTVTLRLRNIDWPIGQNRPSLTLYMLAGSGADVKGYAWGEPDARRIALNIGGTQASCTRDDRAMWR